MTAKTKALPAKTKALPRATKAKGAGEKAVLYVLIDGEHQQALRALAFMRQVPMADLVREAVIEFLANKGPTAADVEDAVKLLRKSLRPK